MKKSSFLFLILSTVFIMGLVSAQDYDHPDSLDTVYADENEVSFTVEKDGDEQDGSLRAEVCGDTADTASTSGGSGQGGVATVDYPANMEFQIPSDAPCSIGNRQIDLITTTPDGLEEETIGSINLEINAKNIGNPHVAENMIINYDAEDNQMRAFQLTDNTWSDIGVSHDGGSYDDTGNLMVQSYSTNTFGIYNGDRMIWNTRIGQILDPSEGFGGYFTTYDECIGDSTRCDAFNSEFNSGNFVDMNVWAELNTISPIHDGGNYRPEGEVVYAHYPIFYDEDGEEADLSPDYFEEYDQIVDDPEYFICREAATMDNGFGDTVPQIVDVSDSVEEYDLLECNTDTGEWNNINRCNQEKIDTTGSGVPDGEPGGECGDTPNCEAGEAYYEDGMFYACYDDGSGNIVEEPYSEWGTSTQDWTESNSDTNIDYGPRTDLFPFEFSCDANEECSRADSHDEGDWRESWRDYGTMNYVEYIAWPSYLESEEDTIGEPFDSKFVTDTGGWSSRTQALNDAEQLYGGSQVLDDASTWDGMNMTNTGNALDSTIYYGDDAEEYSEAWTVANAGSDEEPILPDSPNFQGGWAGECGEDQWRYMGDEDFADNDWICDGATVEDDGGSSGGTTFDTVIIPGFENTAFLPDTEINNDEREIGVVLFPFLNMDSSERQSQLSSDLTDEIVDPYYFDLSDADGEVEGVTVNCWAGRLDDKPETATGEFDHNSERAFSGEASMPSGNQLWSVSDTVDTGGYSGYACEWWYDVTDFSEKARGEEGDVAHVHRDGNLQDMIESEYSSFQEEGFP